MSQVPEVEDSLEAGSLELRQCQYDLPRKAFTPNPQRH